MHACICTSMHACISTLIATACCTFPLASPFFVLFVFKYALPPLTITIGYFILPSCGPSSLFLNLHAVVVLPLTQCTNPPTLPDSKAVSFPRMAICGGREMYAHSIPERGQATCTAATATACWDSGARMLRDIGACVRTRTYSL